MQHLTTTVLEHDEYEQHPHRYRRHRKEINRHQLADVVMKKRLSGLSRRLAECPENSGDRALKLTKPSPGFEQYWMVKRQTWVLPQSNPLLPANAAPRPLPPAGVWHC